jgi:hypothetical protein
VLEGEPSRTNIDVLEGDVLIYFEAIRYTPIHHVLRSKLEKGFEMLTTT